jgi:MFS family permease
MDFAVNVAFPAITAAFALDVQSIRWVVICYVITYASLMLAFGKFGDIVGHRRVFHAGLLTGTLAFAACGLAPSYPWLLAARVLQGIATALVLSCAPALVVAVCGEHRRTWALSRYAMIAAVAGILGPIVGGAGIQWLGWAGVFWFRLPVTLLALVLLARLPAGPVAATTSQRFDPVSAVLLAGGLALLLLSPGLWSSAALIELPLAVGVAGIGLLALFMMRERRDAEPVLPPSAVLDPAMLAANVASVIVNFVGFSIPLLVPYYLARIGEFSAVTMGLLLATSTVGVFTASTFTPRVVHVLGQRRAAILGAALVAMAQGVISLWPLTPALAALMAGLLLHGLGVGLFQVSYTDLIVATLPQRKSRNCRQPHHADPHHRRYHRSSDAEQRSTGARSPPPRGRAHCGGGISRCLQYRVSVFRTAAGGLLMLGSVGLSIWRRSKDPFLESFLTDTVPLIFCSL